MSHPFGDRLSQHLHRKHGLNQSKLAEGILQDRSIVGKMCKGMRLSGPRARERVISMIDWLRAQGVLQTVDEANHLLDAAGMSPLAQHTPDEDKLLQQLHHSPSAPSQFLHRTAPRKRTNLPALLTSFVGRQQELADVAGLVTNNRLVTLTGAGGVGKTRLAQEAAKELITASPAAGVDFSDGIWFLELAALAADEMAVTLIAQAIGRLFQPPELANQTNLDDLVDYLADRYLLLILDNSEHLLDACAKVCEHLLRHCWHLHILTTSREEIRIAGEVVYQVLPLVLPKPEEQNADRVLASSAVQLFVDRMNSAKSSLQRQTINAAIVSHICHQLAGIPLALELAAPLTRTLPLEELMQQLDEQMALLTNSYRNSIPRHQTMHSALAWSYQLLSPEEQNLLMALSAFVGGWTVEAATAIYDDGTANAHSSSLITLLLNQLAAKSFVLIEPVHNARRYRFLEPIRQFAQSQLRANGNEEQVLRRHADYFLSLAEKMEQARDTPQERLWLQKLEPERGNIHAVNRWAFERNEVVFAQRFNGMLVAFWIYCSSQTEARHWLEGVLALKERAGESAPSLFALVTEAGAVHAAAHAAALSHDFDKAQLLFARELELRKQLHDQRGIADALRGVAFVLMLSNKPSEAVPYVNQSLAISYETHDRWSLSWSLFDRGYLALMLEDFVLGQELLQKALLMFVEDTINFGAFRALLALGHLMRFTGDLEQAKRFYQDALLLQQEMRYVLHVADGLEGLAAIAAIDSQWERTITLLGTAHRHRQDYRMPRLLHLQTNYDRLVIMIRRQISSEAWTTFWEAGLQAPLEQAVALALEELYQHKLNAG